MTRRNLSSRPEVWGCIGTVAAALIAGIFSVIVALVSDVSLVDMVDRLRGDGASRQSQIVSPATQSTPTPTPAQWQFPVTDTPDPFPTLDTQLPWESSPASIPTPNLGDIASGLIMSGSSSCPADARAVNMTIPGQWYGPFGFNLNQFIMYDDWNFYTWDSAQYNIFTGGYGVSAQVNRVPNEPVNQWLQLPNSYFWVCIDSSGYLYTVYSGN